MLLGLSFEGEYARGFTGPTPGVHQGVMHFQYTVWTDIGMFLCISVPSWTLCFHQLVAASCGAKYPIYGLGESDLFLSDSGEFEKFTTLGLDFV